MTRSAGRGWRACLSQRLTRRAAGFTLAISTAADEPCRSPVSLHQTLDRLADAVEAALDMHRLEAILNESDPE